MWKTDKRIKYSNECHDLEMILFNFYENINGSFIALNAILIVPVWDLSGYLLSRKYFFDCSLSLVIDMQDLTGLLSFKEVCTSVETDSESWTAIEKTFIAGNIIR